MPGYWRGLCSVCILVFCVQCYLSFVCRYLVASVLSLDNCLPLTHTGIPTLSQIILHNTHIPGFWGCLCYLWQYVFLILCSTLLVFGTLFSCCLGSVLLSMDFAYHWHSGIPTLSRTVSHKTRQLKNNMCIIFWTRGKITC